MAGPRFWTRQQSAHAGILALAGFDLHRAYLDDFKLPPKDQRKHNLRAGRHLLCQLTGHDCGYDLADWWNLLAALPLSILRLRAFPRVLRAVRAAMVDVVRQRLVEELIAEDAAANPAVDPPVL